MLPITNYCVHHHHVINCRVHTIEHVSSVFARASNKLLFFSVAHCLAAVHSLEDKYRVNLPGLSHLRSRVVFVRRYSNGKIFINV